MNVPSIVWPFAFLMVYYKKQQYQELSSAMRDDLERNDP